MLGIEEKCGDIGGLLKMVLNRPQALLRHVRVKYFVNEL